MFHDDQNVQQMILLIYLINMKKFSGLNNNNHEIVLNEIILINKHKKIGFIDQYHFRIPNGIKNGI
jgi:hypothetical protein